MARPSCLRLFWHCKRAAASRIFCTAGKSRLIRMPMMAITTSSSISVNAGLRVVLAEVIRPISFVTNKNLECPVHAGSAREVEGGQVVGALRHRGGQVRRFGVGVAGGQAVRGAAVALLGLT